MAFAASSPLWSRPAAAGYSHPPALQFDLQATTPALFNVSSYPLSIIFAPSDVHQARAIASIVTQFKWKRVAVVGTTDVCIRNKREMQTDR